MTKRSLNSITIQACRQKAGSVGYRRQLIPLLTVHSLRAKTTYFQLHQVHSSVSYTFALEMGEANTLQEKQPK